MNEEHKQSLDKTPFHSHNELKLDCPRGQNSCRLELFEMHTILRRPLPRLSLTLTSRVADTSVDSEFHLPEIHIGVANVDCL